MPYGKKRGKKRTGRKKVGKRRGRKSRMGIASKAIIRSPTGISDSTFVKLKYRQLYTANHGSGQLVYNIFSGNSLYDPDISGLGHQPYFFDQWSTFYSKYTVLGSSISAKAFMESGGNTFAVLRTGIFPSPISTSISSTNEALEQPYNKSKLAHLYNADSKNSTVKHYISTNKILGLPKGAITNDIAQASALVTANPTQQFFWHVYTQPFDETQAVVAKVEVILTYYVRLANRARPSTS